MGCGNLRRAAGIVKKPAGGLPVIKEKMREMIATERYKRMDLQCRCLKWVVNWRREDEREWGTEEERKKERDREVKKKKIAQLWEITGCFYCMESRVISEMRASAEENRWMRAWLHPHWTVYAVRVCKCLHKHMCVCVCVCVCAWREQRSIKRAFHLTGLSIFSMKNLCFQLSHRYPWERERQTERQTQSVCAKRWLYRKRVEIL